MKKILFAIAIVLTIGLTANAQGKRDGFFSSGWDDNTRGDAFDDVVLPTTTLINGGQFGNDYDAPLGSGLLVLTALGVGYAVARKKSKK